MTESYPILYTENVTPEEEKVLFEGLISEAAAAKGMSRIQPFALLIKNSNNKVVAGAKGISLYGCLYVSILWVASELRHQGIGTRLIQASEQLGKERECTFVCLTTMDWEALPFYQKLGYQIEYIREGYEKNSKMFALRKQLYG